MSKKDQHLESQATAINTAHAKACESVRTGLEYARSAGEALLNVKRQLDHGEFCEPRRGICGSHGSGQS